MTYKFTYRRQRWPYHRTYVVVGHQFQPEQNKICLFFPDGSIREIARWDRCSLKLGVDWVNAVKKNMEAQAGQTVPLNV